MPRAYVFLAVRIVCERGEIGDKIGELEKSLPPCFDRYNARTIDRNHESIYTFERGLTEEELLDITKKLFEIGAMEWRVEGCECVEGAKR